MTEVTLNLRKTLEQNAAEHFERAKKARRKIKRIQQILIERNLELERAQAELTAAQMPAPATPPRRKPQWYEKFRWFLSTEGFLVIGGRDATTNEVIIKKHTAPLDIVFHTDMAGSPFFVVKADSATIPIGQATLQEAADATCSFSRAWKNGMMTTDTFWVKPEQVSKQANPGEFMGKGAFMIRGKTNYLSVGMDLAIGLTAAGAVMCGPKASVATHCAQAIPILQGNEKTSDVAKRLRHLLGAKDLDEIIRALPAGGVKLEGKHGR